MSDQPKSLAHKMASIMGEVPTMLKDGQNVSQRYGYTTAEQVKAALRPLLKKHNIALFANMLDLKRESAPTKSGGSMTTTIAHMRFTLVCGDTGEQMDCEWYGEAADSGDKSVNKAATAALKYFCTNTFLLSTTEPEADEDTVYVTGNVTPHIIHERMPAEPAGKVTKSQLAAIRTLATQLWGPDDFVAEGAMYVQETYHRELKGLTDEQAREMIQDLNDRLKLATEPA